MFFLASLGMAFLLVALLYSGVAGKGYIVGRYDLAAWPAVVMGIALLIESVAHSSPLKKGTGTSGNVVLRAWDTVGLGASPLFQVRRRDGAVRRRSNRPGE